MRYICLFFIFLSIFTSNLNAQNPEIIQQKSFGGAGNDGISLFHIDENKNYYFAGGSNSNISSTKSENSFGFDDFWILKTDENFNIIWDKTIGGNNFDYGSDVVVIENKIYFVGSTESGVSGNKTTLGFGSIDLWLICLDLNGTLLWQNQYGGNDYENYSRIVQFTDTSLLIASESISPISGNKTVASIGQLDTWLLEIGTSSGQIIQQKIIGSTGNDRLFLMEKSPFNNHIYLLHDSQQGSSGDKTDAGFGDPFSSDIWLVELDENLAVIKNKCFGGNESEFPTTIHFEWDGFLIGGMSNSSNSGNKTSPNYGLDDGWLFRLDLDWNIEWDKTYGGDNFDNIQSIFQNSNGNYVLGLNSKSTISGNKTTPQFGTTSAGDIWLLILDSTGEIIKQESYGGIHYEGGKIFEIPYSNTEILIVAASNSGISGNKTIPNLHPTEVGNTIDGWVLKLDASDFLSTQLLTSFESSIKTFPNPFEDKIYFTFENILESVHIQFYTIDGKKIDNQYIEVGTENFTWTTSSNVGVIIYEIIGTKTHKKGKLIQY